MKIQRILIAQPGQASANPSYAHLINKYGVKIDFQPFFSMIPLTTREFMTQKVNIPDYSAIVFSSKGAIDAFFKLCADMRIKMPDSQKYFCTSESISYYLQKHIIYRKRKIFFGDGSFASVVKLARLDKHKNERFLIATPDTSYPEWIAMFKMAGLNFASAVVAKFVHNNIKNIKLTDYQLVALYNSLDISSLKENFPDFKQNGTKFIAFSSGVRKAMQEAGLNYTITGPTKELPSMANAIEKLINEPNFVQTELPQEPVKVPFVLEEPKRRRSSKKSEPQPKEKSAPKAAATAVKKAATAKKAAPAAKKAAPAAKKATPVKKATPAKKATPVKKAATPAKKAMPVKKAAPAAKKATPVKKAATPAKKAAPVKKAAPAKKATPAKKSTAAKKPTATKKK